MNDYYQMTGKHFLVTGATSGIGKETAIILSQLGAKVAIVGRREKKLQETLSSMQGTGHSMHAIDVSEINVLEEKIKAIVKETGAFDGFVHSAGIVKNLPIANFKYERLHEIMLTNFYSFYEITRVLCRKGRYNEGFSVVGVSSVAATHGAATQSAYGASKAAMNGAMRCLAKELGSKGIRFNTVLPAATNTEMYSTYMALKADMKDTDMKIEANPRQYLGMNAPADVANAIIYLLSPLSGKITGVQLPVDGGYASC